MSSRLLDGDVTRRPCPGNIRKGALELGTVSDFGSPDSPNADKLMHARLATPDGYTQMVWDVPEGAPYHPGNNIAVYLGGADGNLRGYFVKLSAGGTVTIPLEMQAWGDEAGPLVDQFGVTWMFNITRQHT